ncbi:hypothetical protein AVEN_71962-1 [Araneus ventricosus]|uniref:Uncharacterized protein n=1 Tax=Araneus ventricosus TaxID=182803 RepID=A0A4Y2F764_ARAVE|nr:hypothetical protein AVEN_71962-1 [Araneus ventricosus]
MKSDARPQVSGRNARPQVSGRNARPQSRSEPKCTTKVEGGMNGRSLKAVSSDGQSQKKLIVTMVQSLD